MLVSLTKKSRNTPKKLLALRIKDKFPTPKKITNKKRNVFLKIMKITFDRIPKEDFHMYA